MWPAGGEHPMAMGRGPAAPPSTSSRLPARHSPWQSPVPYLFGGLAAMLGLIALSLLALACSYWKLSGSLLDAGDPADDGQLDQQQPGAGSRRRGDGKAAAAGDAGLAGDQWREQHVVVIMAGDERPTFLATPASSWGWGADAHHDLDVACGGAPDDGRCVECGAISRPARPAGGELSLSPSDEQSGVGGSSVINEG
ncbi:hypothetical protein BS78_04G058000 [Paspalum vaginatum]|nr:hypothetical protein BS78_04G058000 [Paspalum vaginatum]KAJ1278163.1 hypothetical protein BS78_04G058000 [Paspalum vaginatum]KAJ1278164.1 hypothetical protein BS78_04G058000 [Paspalum vaginatum]KAJ1278165.1 hypothetical protein BS78_04G058000 [Paspalum vaginatum]